MVRTPDDERYDAVRSVLIGDTRPRSSRPIRHARVLPRPLLPPPGAAGRRLTPRMNSVLTYSVESGHMLSEMAQRMYYGRTA